MMYDEIQLRKEIADRWGEYGWHIDVYDMLLKSARGEWNTYPENRPKEYGKYFVCRKDGKVHWETWNGSGWAYNEKVITHWREVKSPTK